MATLFMGSDPWAGNLHRHLAECCRAWGHQVTEVNQPGGERVAYHEVARRVAVAVAGQPDSRGIVLCGTGMGVSMVANRFPGISCALCETVFAAEKSRILNNANVLAMGELITTAFVAEAIAKAFLTTEFLSGIEPALAAGIRGWHQAVRELDSRIAVPNWMAASSPT
jgi:ribose 5-phosphate isomerase B